MGMQETTVKARTLWQLLALDDAELEATDLVEMNLSVAREIPLLEQLDVARYCRIVDEWTERFRKWLPGAVRTFHKTPGKWKNDIRFFRVGMLAGFLGHEIGIRYIEEHKHSKAAHYTNPNELFLNGLIDTKKGSCANMAALHVAMSRKMGWRVSLACVRPHFISRFDDGRVIHNIEATNTDHPGTFCSEEDEYYMKKENLPKRAIECGSDLRSLTAREMMGVFFSLRARHFRDVGNMDCADQDYAMSRALFPKYRYVYINGMIPMLRRGEQLFERGEFGHPESLFEALAPMFAEDEFKKAVNGLSSGWHSFPMLAKPLPTHEVINGIVMNRESSEPKNGELIHEPTIGKRS